MAAHYPFNDNDLIEINNSLRELEKVETTLKRAVMAGIDVSLQSDAAKEARGKLTKLKNAFFTGN